MKLEMEYYTITFKLCKVVGLPDDENAGMVDGVREGFTHRSTNRDVLGAMNCNTY